LEFAQWAGEPIDVTHYDGDYAHLSSRVPLDSESHFLLIAVLEARKSGLTNNRITCCDTSIGPNIEQALAVQQREMRLQFAARPIVLLRCGILKGIKYEKHGRSKPIQIADDHERSARPLMGTGSWQNRFA
jgi:hypothetical protein